jgi:hypothetical protein
MRPHAPVHGRHLVLAVLGHLAEAGGFPLARTKKSDSLANEGIKKGEKNMYRLCTKLGWSRWLWSGWVGLDWPSFP